MVKKLDMELMYVNFSVVTIYKQAVLFQKQMFNKLLRTAYYF